MEFKFHFVNTLIPQLCEGDGCGYPENVYFQNNVYKVFKKTTDPYVMYAYDLSSCRYNELNVAIYCEFKMDNDIYRLKLYDFIRRPKCDLIKKYLEHKDGLYYFKEVRANYGLAYVLPSEAFEGYHENNNLSEIFISTRECNYTLEYKKFTIIKV